MQNNDWVKLKKFLAFLTAVLLWTISIVFSYNGFKLDANQGMTWIGIIMAFAITVLELIFNTNNPDRFSSKKADLGEWMLLFGGILAYVYDVWTNILGFYAARGLGTPSISTIDLNFIVPLLVGLFMAILPEPLFVWGLRVKLSHNIQTPTTQSKPSTPGFNPRDVRGHSMSKPTPKPKGDPFSNLFGKDK